MSETRRFHLSMSATASQLPALRAPRRRNRGFVLMFSAEVVLLPEGQCWEKLITKTLREALLAELGVQPRTH